MVDAPPGRGLLTALYRTLPRPGRRGVNRGDVPPQRRDLAARLHHDLPARRVRARRRPRRRPHPTEGDTMSTVLGVPAGQPSLSVPLFTGVRGIRILRTSPYRSSPKLGIASIQHLGVSLAEFGLL